MQVKSITKIKILKILNHAFLCHHTVRKVGLGVLTLAYEHELMVLTYQRNFHQSWMKSGVPKVRFRFATGVLTLAYEHELLVLVYQRNFNQDWIKSGVLILA